MDSVLRKLRRLLSCGRRRSEEELFGKTRGRSRDIVFDEPMPVAPDLEAAIAAMESLVAPRSGLEVRRLAVLGREARIVYIHEIVDESRMEESVLKPLFDRSAACPEKPEFTPDSVATRIVHSASIERRQTIQDAVWGMLNGECVLFGEGWKEALAVKIPGWCKRPVAEPDMEITLRGPREGFIEDLDTNIGLVRKRLRHPRLNVLNLTLGRLTRTRVAILYVEGLPRLEVVTETIARVRRIDIDGILDTSYIEEFIEDSPFSPFPQVGSTERPDRTASSLLQGRVAILAEDSPFALLVPFTGVAFLQSPEDYYQKWLLSILTRTVRFMSVTLSLLLPAFYVALTTYHPEVIPRPLALAIATQREAIPYPAVAEALAITLVFEIVIEASVRLPRPMGETIGIVGTLVIGQSAVRANLVSSAMLIVVAATAVTQFTVAQHATTTIRLLRIPMLVLASILGLFGIFAGIVLILLHVAVLRSFGQPYLSPIAPVSVGDMSDIPARLPWWAHVFRPALMASRNLVRTAPGQKPGPPRDRSDALELEQEVTRVRRSPNPPRPTGRPGPTDPPELRARIPRCVWGRGGRR